VEDQGSNKPTPVDVHFYLENQIPPAQAGAEVAGPLAKQSITGVIEGPTSAPPNPKAPDGHIVTKSAAQTYISRRLDPQLSWFDKNARRYKYFHYSLLVTSLISTALIVVANGLHYAALSTGLAVAATIATGLATTAKFQEHWVRYRRTATALEGLKLRYEVGSQPFDGITKHGLMIEEAEKIFAQEQSQWETKSIESSPRT
jgi:hypothetical protein